MTTEPIPAESLFPDLPWEDFKIHVAQRSGKVEPIDVFTQDRMHWEHGWNGAWHTNNCWSRNYIFSMIELPREKDRWLFGGVFKVLSRKKGKRKAGPNKGRDGMVYEVCLCEDGEALIGRLVIHWVKTGRAKGRIPATMLDEMAVAELLPEPYVGRTSRVMQISTTAILLWSAYGRSQNLTGGLRLRTAMVFT